MILCNRLHKLMHDEKESNVGDKTDGINSYLSPA